MKETVVPSQPQALRLTWLVVVVRAGGVVGYVVEDDTVRIVGTGLAIVGLLMLWTATATTRRPG